MRVPLRHTLPLVLLCGGAVFLPAQTTGGGNGMPANPQPSRENRLISFLTPAQQDQYAEARAKALENNPDLAREGESLLSEGQAIMANGTPADKQMFLEKMDSHRQKLRQAMLKEDPTLEPVFSEIDKHISEEKAKHLASMQNSAGSTNTPPVHAPASP
jgi:hypothetical protein